MGDNDYYKNLWTDPNNHGGKFWKNVDFSAPQYKFQEDVFRNYIRKLDKNEIKTVLEIGAGTGRMTKIMLEEFPDYEWYTPIDISKDNIMKMFKTLGNGKELPRNIYPLTGDIIDYVNLKRENPIIHYDLILASEVFMHIKPEDIENVIDKLSKIGKQIINIDWAYAPYESDWCFIHPYHELYTKYGARMQSIVSMENIKQALFHYRFSD